MPLQTLRALRKMTGVLHIKKMQDAYYFEIYKTTEKTAGEEVAFVLESLQVAPGAKILDLGCGFGRHAVAFAKGGYGVTAVDISKKLLAIAKERAKKAGVRIQFLQGDIRRLTLKREFDAVVFMLNTFGLLSDRDNEQVLRRAAVALKPGGKILIDQRNPERLKRGDIYGTLVKREGSRRVYLSQDGQAKIYTEMTFYPALKRVLIERRNVRPNRREEVFIMTSRLYGPQEMRGLFVRNGLTMLEYKGDFRGRPYKKEKSSRLIFLGEKTRKN